MIAALLLFLLSLLGLLGAVNALRGPATHRPPPLRPPFLPALLTAEAVPLRVAIHAAIAALLIWAGALDYLAGRVGLVLTVLTWLAYLLIQWRAASTKKVMAAALDRAGIDASGFAHVDWRRVLRAYPYQVPKDVERLDDIEYAPGLHLDVYRRSGSGDEPRPALLYVHGGSWRGGNRRQQGRPLLHRLARNGWIGVSASYPLVPAATFPDQLIALKKAVAWMRNEGAAYGIDGDFIAICGGSAGGHLAALTALTAGRPEYQTGFEEVDTSVQAAIPVYGIYDFLNRNRTRDDWPIIPRWVMKAEPREAEELFRLASPLDQVHAGAPPFLIIHGAVDSVVPTAEAHQFEEALRAVSESEVVYAEIPGANHAFDVLDSLRTHYVISGVQRFLEAIRTARSVT
ncbi:MAG: alpha/beta hydrolase [Acidimicrobiia bacterium]|nr:alpha/beta hydrolase [Acidimicrobiia bacterium]